MARSLRIPDQGRAICHDGPTRLSTPTHACFLLLLLHLVAKLLRAGIHGCQRGGRLSDLMQGSWNKLQVYVMSLVSLPFRCRCRIRKYTYLSGHLHIVDSTVMFCASTCCRSVNLCASRLILTVFMHEAKVQQKGRDLCVECGRRFPKRSSATAGWGLVTLSVASARKSVIRGKRNNKSLSLNTPPDCSLVKKTRNL